MRRPRRRRLLTLVRLLVGLCVLGLLVSVTQPQAAFAVMEIKTVYTDSGNRQGAIKELNALLQTTQNDAVRTVIRFQLLDLQKESGNMCEATEILRAIVEENLK